MKRPASLGPRWVRLIGWVPVGGLAIALTWLLCTENGLQAAVKIAHRLTGGALTVKEARGALAYDLSLDEVRYEIPSVTISIGHADLSLRLLPLLAGRVQAARLDVAGLLVQTHDTPADPSRKRLTVSMPLGLAVEEGHLSDFRIQIGDDAGVSQKDDRSPALAHGASGWRWQLPLAEFAAQWRGRWIVIGAVSAQTHEAGTVSTRGRIAIVDDQLLIEDMDVKGRGTARIAGALALHDGVPNDLSASWRDARWINDEALTWLASPRGHATLKGPWHDYRWTAQGNALYSGIPADVTGRGRGSLGAITLEQVAVKTLEGSIAGEGRVEWFAQLATAFRLHWVNLNPGAQYKDWNGHLSGAGSFDAQWPSGTPRMNFDATLADSQLRGYPLALQISGRTEDREVFLKMLRVQSGATQVSAQGRLLPAFGITGEVRSSDLRSLWAGLAGSGLLQVQLRGTPQAPELELHGGLDDLSYARYRAGHVGVDASLAPQGFSRAALDLADVRAGAALKEVKLRAQGTQAKHEATAEARSADGNAQATFTGGLTGAAWRGELTRMHVAPARGEDWVLEGPSEITYARSRLEVEPVCLNSGSSRACAHVTIAPGVLDLAFRTRDFDLTHLRPWLPGELALTGTLSGTAALGLAQGELVDISADLTCSAGLIAAGGSKLEYGPGELRIQPEDRRLHATVHLRPGGGDLVGDVWVAPGASLPDRPMLGELHAHLPDLSWLPVLSPEIGSAQGSLDSTLQVSGTPRSPKLDGSLQLAGGRVQLVTPGIELTDITASFSRKKAAPLSLHAEARSGGGTLVVDGALKELQPHVLGEIMIKGENVQGFNTAEFRAWLSPDLKLTLEQGLARLTGTLVVPRAEITPRELVSGGVAPSGDQVIVEDAGEQRAGRLRVETQVRIVLGDNVRFDGLGLKTRLTGAITAIDDPERPTRGLGELRLDGGRYKAYGQDLTIETGRLIFGGGPVTDPAVDLTAYRKPLETIKVGLHARGTLEAPEFSLFSEPAMSQEEQLSWLVLGRSLSGTLDTAQATQLSGAALSLGLTGGEYLAQQLAPTLGLDEVSLGARPGETADLARFTVGKYLSPKLFVSYGVGLFQPGHYFRMRYDLSKHFKLQGESGTQQGGDVIYSIEK